MMKKLFCSILFLVFVLSSVSADTANVISQYRIGIIGQEESIVNEEVNKLRREGYTVTKYKNDEWDTNSWGKYISDVAMKNRSWFTRDQYSLIRTNLVSNPGGRKWVVFTFITGGSYNTTTLEITSDIEYEYWVFEIK
jgi:hypothetical protein